MAVEVFDELPTRGGGGTKRKSVWLNRAAEAAEHPTKWVVVGDYKSAQSAGAAASGFNRDHKEIEGYDGMFRAASRTLTDPTNDGDVTRYVVLIRYAPEDTVVDTATDAVVADDDRVQEMDRVFHEVLDHEEDEEDL